MVRTAVPEPKVAPTLDEVGRVLDGFCDGFDAALITGSQGATVVDRVGTMIRRLQGVQAATVARVDECGVAKGHGFSSTAAWLAAHEGSSMGEAVGVVEVGRALEAFPATAAKVRSGDLSLGAARQVTGAARTDPSAEQSLLGVAERRDFNVLRERADRVRQGARSAEDAQARHERIRRGRRFSEFPESDGGVRLDGLVAPADWAAAKAVIDAHQCRIFDQARRRGDRESSAAYRADALVAAILGGAIPADASPVEPCPSAEVTVPNQAKVQVIVLVDALALKRGWTAPGECCEIPGVGSVPIPWVQRLLPDVVASAVIHDCVDIRAYCSLTRHIPTSIRVGLAARDRTCVVPNCANPIGLQIDHQHDHAQQGPTTWVNLGHLCPRHHHQKSHRGARLERRGDEWLWWPPPGPDPGSDNRPVPWRAPIGEHLHPWDPDAATR